MQLGNHLGNVLVTISDKKKGVADPLNAALIKFFEPYMLSGTDYYPFGMAMRVGGDNKYKFGFNGKENDNEVKGGDGLQQDYGMRVYDNRIGRFLSEDPLTGAYPFYTPYQFAGNMPIMAVDLDGLEPEEAIITEEKAGKTALKIAWKKGNGKVVQMVAKNAIQRTAFVNIVKNAGVGLLLGIIREIFSSPQTSPQDVAKGYPGVQGTPKEDLFWGTWVGPGRNFPLPPTDPDLRPQWFADYWPEDMPINFPLTGKYPSIDSKPVDEDDNDPEYITLHRGVNAQINPTTLYILAQKGIAYPKGFLPGLGFPPHEDSYMHTASDNYSIWTSWTSSIGTATYFARGALGDQHGVVLTKRFKKSQLVVSTLAPSMQENEYLVQGVVTGAKVEDVEPLPKRE